MYFKMQFIPVMAKLILFLFYFLSAITLVFSVP